MNPKMFTCLIGAAIALVLLFADYGLSQKNRDGGGGRGGGGRGRQGRRQKTPKPPKPKTAKELEKEAEAERKKKFDETETEYTTNLDEAQQNAVEEFSTQVVEIRNLEGALPPETRDAARDLVFVCFSGTHKPTKEHSNKVALQLIDWVKKRSIEPYDALDVVTKTAEAISESELHKDALDALLISVEEIMGTSRLDESAIASLRQNVETLFKEAKPDDAKIKQRKEAKKKEEEEKQKALLKKLEEEKKKAERKAKIGQRRGGRGNTDDR